MNPPGGPGMNPPGGPGMNPGGGPGMNPPGGPGMNPPGGPGMNPAGGPGMNPAGGPGMNPAGGPGMNPASMQQQPQQQPNYPMSAVDHARMRAQSRYRMGTPNPMMRHAMPQSQMAGANQMGAMPGMAMQQQQMMHTQGMRQVRRKSSLSKYKHVVLSYSLKVW